MSKCKTHVQGLQSHCFCSLRLLFGGILIAVIVLLPNNSNNYDDDDDDSPDSTPQELFSAKESNDTNE